MASNWLSFEFTRDLSNPRRQGSRGICVAIIRRFSQRNGRNLPWRIPHSSHHMIADRVYKNLPTVGNGLAVALRTELVDVAMGFFNVEPPIWQMGRTSAERPTELGTCTNQLTYPQKSLRMCLMPNWRITASIGTQSQRGTYYTIWNATKFTTVIMDLVIGGLVVRICSINCIMYYYYQYEAVMTLVWYLHMFVKLMYSMMIITSMMEW